jgi:tetratricopeptide (TPR) repeat protein
MKLCLIVIFVFIFLGISCVKEETMNKSSEMTDKLFAEGYFDDAQVKYEKLIESLPDDCNIIQHLAFIYYFKGQYPKALTYFEKVTQLEPSKKGMMLAYSAYAYYLMSDYGKVVTILEKTKPVNFLNKEQLKQLINTPVYQIETKITQTTIPFIQLDPTPVIEIEVNNQKIFVMIDTGGIQLALDRDFARQADVKLFATEQIKGFAGNKEASVLFGKADSVTLDAIQVKNVPVWLLDTKKMSKDFGREINGILGTELLMRFIPTLDYTNKKLILRVKNENNRKEISQMPAKLRLPFILDEIHAMMAQCYINGKGPVLMYFDSGFADDHNASLVLTGAALKDLGIPKPVIDQEGIGGGDGVIKSGYVDIDQIRVGDLIQEKQRAVYYEGVEGTLMTPSQYKTYGLISHNFLKHYIWTIDFDNRLFIFN